MRKRTGCFFLLSVFLLFITGCGKVTNLKDVTWGPETLQTGVAETETDILTLDKLEERFEEKREFDCYFESSCHSTYAYDLLSEAEKIWYEDMNKMLASFCTEGVSLSSKGLEMGLTEQNIDKIYQSVLIDHPEYFFVEGYEYVIYTANKELVGIEICGKYPYSLEECKARKAQIDAATNELLKGAPADGRDYDKIKYVYETLIFNTEYCMEASDNQNIYSVLVGHASVCQGYSKATQYLLHLLGVECTLVFGEVKDNEGHSWNLVRADGEYYYLDTTWGDASYTAVNEAMQNNELPKISYDYLCITTEQLEKTHRITHQWQLPECCAVSDNYYRKEGCYFSCYDEERIKQLFADAAQSGQQYVTLKCSDGEVYTYLYNELLTNQRVFEYLPDTYENIAYIENQPQLSMTFWMTN